MNLLVNNPLPMDTPTHYIRVNSFLHEEMRTWIAEQDSQGRVWAKGHGLLFERKEDATIFALRWA